MAIFKVLRCTSCKSKRHDSTPPSLLDTLKTCPKCGGPLRYLPKWYYSYQIGGRKFLRAAGTHRKKAETDLSRAHVDIDEGKHFDRSHPITWPMAAEEFRKYFRMHCKTGTQGMYENSLKHLADHFGKMYPHQISLPMVERYKEERIAKVKPASVDRDLATLKKMFSLLEEQDLIQVNKMRRIKLLRVMNQRTRHLTEEEILRLLAECKSIPHLHLGVLIALHTGLRKGTIYGLTWSNIEFKEQTITVFSKGDRRIHVPLTRILLDALKEWRKDRKVSRYLFPSRIPGGTIKIDKSFRSACTRAKISDFRFHDLRHTFLTRLVEITKDLRVAQEIAGHTTQTMTTRYSHVIDRQLRDALKQYEDKWPG